MALRIIVLQSQNPQRLVTWQQRCCATVEAWARRHGYGYRRSGDELFDRLPDGIRTRHAAQPVVLSDLARLLWLREALAEGFDHAIWCDADLLLFRDFAIGDEPDRFGRECWVQRSGRRLRSYRKIHNAWLQFHRASTTLPFYIERATALLARAPSPVVPQFIGPKLLTAWHNLIPFAVEERIGMLSPLVMHELLDEAQEPEALTALLHGHGAPLCGLNLSASYAGRSSDGIQHTARDYERLVDAILEGDLVGRLGPVPDAKKPAGPGA